MFYNYSTTTANLQFNQDNNAIIGQEQLDPVRIIFEYFFTTEHTMKKQNMFLLTFLEYYIANNRSDIVKQFLSETALNDLHASLLNSTIFMIENIPQLQDEKHRIAGILNEKLNA